MGEGASVSGRVLGVVAYIVGATLLGLAPAMAFGGFSLFAKVWSASASGDAVFVLGMAAVGWFTFDLGWRKVWWAAAMVGVLGTWAVFAFSFSITGAAMDGSGQNGSSFNVDLANVWGFVFGWGWPGIVWGVGAPIVAARMLRSRRESPRPAVA
jgi:hypothetical protein